MLLDDHGRIDNSLRSGTERGNGRVSEGHRPAVRHSNGSDGKKGEDELWMWALGAATLLGIAGVGYIAVDNMNKQRIAQQQMVAAAQQNSVQQQREKEMHDAQPQPQPQSQPQQPADIPATPYSDPQVNTGDYSDTNAAAQNTIAVTPDQDPVKELEEEDPDSIISTYAPRF